MIRHIVLIGLGGGLGSIARYYCQKWVNNTWPNYFPLGTFVVNFIGCLLIGILWGLLLRDTRDTENWRLFLMTGLCGGFTTFSAFTLEGNELIRQNKPGVFLLYITGSVVLGLVATFAGMRLTR